MNDAIIVTTQEEMDAVIADASVAHRIEVRGNGLISVSPQCPLDVLVFDSVTVTACGSAAVWACDSSKVNACDSSMVWARDSSAVTACGSATVRASDSSAVTAYGSATVQAFGSSAVHARGSSAVTSYGSATVRAFDSASVTAYGSSAVHAYDSSTVTAYDSASVTAFDSASVTTCDSSAVHAYDSSTVTAYDSASVTARDSSTVHLHSTRVTHTGGVIIDCTTIDETDPATWGDYHGAQVESGTVTLYKCLPKNLTSGADWDRPTIWPTSGDIECADFEATDECGHGLHLSPTPGHAWAYLADESHPRFLEVTAPLDDIVPITGGTAKCKVQRCTVVREVDVMGRPVTSEVAKS